MNKVKPLLISKKATGIVRKPVAVMAADTHLAPRAWAWRQIEGDSYCSFQQLVDAAIKFGVPLVLAGDVIDRSLNHAPPIIFLAEQLERLAEEHLTCYFIVGQHDADDTTWLSVGRSATHIHQAVTRLGDVSLWGLDYQPAGDFQRKISEIPTGVDIAVLHQTLGEFMGSVCSPQGSIGDVPVVSTVFVGDYHVYKDMSVIGADGQKVHVISPGSTCLQEISEPVDKFACLLYDSGEIEKFPLTTRRLLDCGVLHSPDTLEKLIAEIGTQVADLRKQTQDYPEAIRKPLIRVKYSHQLGDAKRRILAAVVDTAHVFCQELPPAKFEKSATLVAGVAADSAVTMDTAAKTFLASRELSYLANATQRLLQAEDIDGELQRMRAEALAQAT